MRKLLLINPVPLILITIISCIGFVVLYSAGAGDNYDWWLKQILRLCLGIMIMLSIAIIDIRLWFQYTYLLYFISLIFLIIVEALGFVGMGAKRWINLCFFNFQPSELLRVFLILSLAKYFHALPFLNINENKLLVIPTLMIFMPVILLLRQPDLGTAVILLISSISIFLVAGIDLKKFFVAFILLLISLPIAWHMLYEYQKKRILVYFDTDADILGSGYHILQSKIAIGSGGIFGKGFMQGTQSYLNFLPEKHTDFIFSMFCEEFGLIGAIVLFILYLCLIFSNYVMAFRSGSLFGKFLTIGFTSSLFIYICINIGMVMGIFPVVGIPLPFMSYGGTTMITLLISQGLMMSAYIHSKVGV